MMKKGWFSNLFKEDADADASAKSPKSATGDKKDDKKKARPTAAEAKPKAAKSKPKGGNGSAPIDVGGQMTLERREAFGRFMHDRNKILENLSGETRRRIEQAVRRQMKNPNGG